MIPTLVDGDIIEPHVSEPIAKPTNPADVAAPGPADDPLLRRLSRADARFLLDHDSLAARDRVLPARKVFLEPLFDAALLGGACVDVVALAVLNLVDDRLVFGETLDAVLVEFA